MNKTYHNALLNYIDDLVHSDRPTNFTGLQSLDQDIFAKNYVPKIPKLRLGILFDTINVPP